jgi:hypothetical protein
VSHEVVVIELLWTVECSGQPARGLQSGVVSPTWRMRSPKSSISEVGNAGKAFVPAWYRARIYVIQALRTD